MEGKFLMVEEKVIIIGGGVGPLAGVKLHEYIIENTLTDGSDQDHFEVYHLSRSGDIADRTASLLAGTPEIPAEGMFKTFAIANAALKKTGKSGIGGVPCNTFHAPAIFEHFNSLVEDAGFTISIINMLKETASYIKANYPSIQNIGLLSTTGTRKARVYNDILEPFGFTILQISEENQNNLHDSIYNKKLGIKATSTIHPVVRERFEKYVRLLKTYGAEAIILGCTEIPLALPEKELYGIPLIDPMLALARALIREANPEKLKQQDL